MNSPRLTLGRAFGLLLGGLALLLGALFYVVFRDSSQTILHSAELQRQFKAEQIAAAVSRELASAQRTLVSVESRLATGALRPDDLGALEAQLFGDVLTNPRLAEVTFTRATRSGFESDGTSVLLPDGRWQLSLFRVQDGAGSRILTRIDRQEGGRFVCDLRDRQPGAGFAAAPLRRQADAGVVDPTQHPTFVQAARESNAGSLLWSDLHYSQLDAALPEPARRVVVTVQRSISGPDGRFIGVLRVGTLTGQIDQLVRLRPEDPETAFLCDSQGRLISRLRPGDSVSEMGDDLRFDSRGAPPAVLAALRLPLLAEISRAHPAASADLELAGAGRQLVSFRAIYAAAPAVAGPLDPAEAVESQDWIVGIVVPEAAYLAGLEQVQRRLQWVSLGTFALVLLLGWLALRAVRGSLDRIVDVTARMRSFDFAASSLRAPFADVQTVIERLEMAKTALRALGRYVPISLVRILYQSNREPTLGGELQQVSLMFTDIEDFTTLSERLTPNELARALGRYLEVMTTSIHQTQGIIDKYIGDAVMAVWNVPLPCANHARLACDAALRCQEACARLFASGEWADLPAFHTRFGLHSDAVMVGHFGAPDRMSYTALGDGVNLASRLEGLNKQYGTTVLVSEAVRDEAGEGFVFRLLDVVAVKGKQQGVRVHELVGRAGECDDKTPLLAAYELALEAYWQRDFAAALTRLLPQLTTDAPSQVLARRCRQLQQDPPAADWDGTFVSTAK